MSCGKPLNLQERKKIEELIKQNYSLSDIARTIGRAKNTVITDVRRNGGRNEYTAEKSMETSRKRMILKLAALTTRNKEPKISPLSRMLSRVDVLEMHVDILIDEINKLKERK
jgi:IS30 family transposase